MFTISHIIPISVWKCIKQENHIFDCTGPLKRYYGGYVKDTAYMAVLSPDNCLGGAQKSYSHTLHIFLSDAVCSWAMANKVLWGDTLAL